MKPYEIHNKKSAVWDFTSKGLVMGKGKKATRRQAKKEIKKELDYDDFVCDDEQFNIVKCKTECDWCKYWNNYL